VKICGVRRQADVEAAAGAGADAIGLVFYPDSPRALSVVEASAVAAKVPPFVAKVALFLDAEPALIDDVVARVRPDLLQFHGTESPDACEAFGVPYIKAVPMGDDVDLAEWADRYRNASGMLLDSHRLGEAGGTGRGFGRGIRPAIGKPIILAGGLTPDNVADAVADVRPYAVDVSSGVEAVVGEKSPALIHRFIEAVERVDRHRAEYA